MKNYSGLFFSLALSAAIMACHLPLSAASESGRVLSIQVGYTPSSQSGSARLLLPTSTWAVVTLTDSHGVSQKISQALSGQGKDSFSFSGVTTGAYTVSAQAYADSSESSLLFANSVPFTFTNQSKSVQLYLLPTVTTVYDASAQSGTAVSGSVSAGSSVTLKYTFNTSLELLTFTGLPTSVPYYLQNQLGVLLTDISGGILSGATGGALYLTIYNTTGTVSPYNVTETLTGL